MKKETVIKNIKQISQKLAESPPLFPKHFGIYVQ